MRYERRGFKLKTPVINTASIEDLIKRLDFTRALSGKIRGHNQQLIREIVTSSAGGGEQRLIGAAYTGRNELPEAFQIHPGQTFVTKNGTVVMIASTVLDSEQVDYSQTIFDSPEHQEAKGDEKADQAGTAAAVGETVADTEMDDHSQYQRS